MSRSISARRKQLEKIIEDGLSTFVQVGNALKQIQSSGVYRETHDTFDAYLADRWNGSRSWAYQQIQSSEAVQAVSTIVDKSYPVSHPLRESHARMLAKVEGENRRADVFVKAWEIAPKDENGNAKLTASHISKARKILDPQPSPEKTGPPSEDDEKSFHDAVRTIEKLWSGGSEPSKAALLKVVRAMSGQECLVCGHQLRAPKRKSKIGDEDFQRFWAVVHRRTGAQGAQKAFKKAIDRVRQQNDWPHPQAVDYLVSRMELFAESPQAKDEVKGQIHPATWLNDGRYDDDETQWLSNGHSKGNARASRTANTIARALANIKD